MKKHIINQSFFDLINNEQSAYMLGLLFADGAVNIKNYNICLCLAEKDKDILTKFASLMFANVDDTDISTYKSKQKPFNNYCRVNVNSKYMINKLINLGCTPRKSMTLRFPEQLKEENILRHFIRGYFDGDGSIIQKTRALTITSTLQFCTKTSEIINKYAAIEPKIYKYKNVYRLTVHGRNKAIKILDWLYRDATIYLRRKNEIYKNIKAESSKYFSKEDVVMFSYFYNSGFTYKKIADLYGCSDSGIRRAINRS